MKAIQVHEHLRGIGTWIDWSHTCDGFHIGDPETELTGVAVAWISVLPALKEAHRLGCNMFVTHEPTFYMNPQGIFDLEVEPNKSKKSFLEKSGMVVYRCHDMWDVMPEIGILDSWAKGLGLHQPPLATAKYYSVHESPAPTLGELARYVAEKIKSIRQETVQVIGNPNKRVSRIAIGTGAITDAQTMYELDPDALIVTDDGMYFWAAGAWAIDLELPMLIVNHPTAEEWGIANLAQYLARQFTNVPVRHIHQGCMYDVVRAHTVIVES